VGNSAGWSSFACWQTADGPVALRKLVKQVKARCSLDKDAAKEATLKALADLPVTVALAKET
jgi:hypothetical protein